MMSLCPNGVGSVQRAGRVNGGKQNVLAKDQVGQSAELSQYHRLDVLKRLLRLQYLCRKRHGLLGLCSAEPRR